MADSQGCVHLSGTAAAASSVKSTPTEAKGAPDICSRSTRDFSPPPSKKVRVEEKSSVKPMKPSRDGGLGSDGSGKEKLQQTPKRQSYGGSPGSWTSFSPVKTSSGTATGGSQTHKVLKQSDFFLHKTPPSSKPKSKDKLSGEKGRGGGEEKKKHKLLLTSGPGSNINNDIRAFNNIPAAKKENGEVMFPAHGKPPCFSFIFHFNLQSFVCGESSVQLMLFFFYPRQRSLGSRKENKHYYNPYLFVRDLCRVYYDFISLKKALFKRRVWTVSPGLRRLLTRS